MAYIPKPCAVLVKDIRTIGGGTLTLRTDTELPTVVALQESFDRRNAEGHSIVVGIQEALKLRDALTKFLELACPCGRKSIPREMDV